MAKRKQAQASSKKQEKKRSKAMRSERTIPDATGDQLAKLTDNLIVSSDLIQLQASQLGDRRLPLRERRALAAQIGSLQGNRHLQRILAAGLTPGGLAEVRTKQQPGSEAIQRAGELEGTKEVSEADQKTINETLNPNITSTGKSKDLIAKDFDTNMIVELDKFVTMAAARAKERLDPKSPKLEMDQVRKIGSESQLVASVLRRHAGAFDVTRELFGHR